MMSQVCAICVYTSAGNSQSTVVFEGASLCLDHYVQAINRSDGMYYDTNDRFHLGATIDALRRKNDGTP
jgi:hypothetical protein